MNRFHIVSLLIAIVCATHAATAIGQVTTQYQFASATPLASGYWVKISVSGSGIYEISYDRLRRMGFADPSKVTVYGTGGTMHNINFLDDKGNRLVEDGVQPVASLHSNEKLVFYAQGDANIKALYQDQVTYFTRSDKNVYSDETYYMLTDSQPVKSADKAAKADLQNVADINYGHSYFYHEKDSIQNLFQSGGLWFGESLLPSAEKPTFRFKAPYYTTGDGCHIYIDVAVGKNQTIDFNVDLNGNKAWAGPKKYGIAKIRSFRVHDGENKLNAESEFLASGTLSVYCTTASYDYLALHLDYLTVSYPVSFGIAARDPDFSYASASFRSEAAGTFRHPAPPTAHVWDVTDPIKVVELETGNGYFYATGRSDGYTDVVAFDPSKTLRQINDGFSVVPNSNLHGLQRDPIDMIIFTTDKFRTYAERFARMRNETEALNCIVVTDTEVYNEFNAGTPDANCHRLLAKMLYQGGDRRLKNVLFFGPMTGDLRNIANLQSKEHCMIAYQDVYTDDIQDVYPYPTLDYYGIVHDYFKPKASSIRPAPITLGVGVLPVTSGQMAGNILKKFTRYYQQSDHSGLVNEIVGFSCTGDNYQHENQSIDISKYIENQAKDIAADTTEINASQSPLLLKETIWPEPLSVAQMKDRVMGALKRGKNIFTYFGHGGLRALSNLSEMTVTANDFANVRNQELGMAFIAACDITNFDHGLSGLGVHAVTNPQGGFIGMVTTLRSVESQENYAFAEQLFNAMYHDPDRKVRTEAPTMGEIFAQGKSKTSNNSKICYVYIGDPSTKLPIPLKKVKLNVPDSKFTGGRTVEISGTVTDINNNGQSGYNGYVTLKLVEPAISIKTSGTAGKKMKDYQLNDLPILAVKGKVENGRFSVKMPLPASVSSFANSSKTVMLPIYAGTYDHTSHMGACGVDSIALASPTSMPDPSDPANAADRTAPEISAEVDARLGVINLKVSDDTALLPGIGAGCGTCVTIDGKEISIASTESRGVAVNEYCATIDLAASGYGRKVTVSATAVDLCGNSSTFSQEFELPEVAQLSLSATSEMAIDKLTFNLAGDHNDSLNLIVTDSDGTIVADLEVSGREFELDTTDIAAGTYRAAVRSHSPLGAKLNSNWVTFTVID